MNFWERYKYVPDRHIRPGNHRCMIMDAWSDTSSAGNEEIVIKLRISRSPLEVRYYLVDNEKFEENMSRFFDAFPDLNESFDFARWRGQKGACELSTDKRNSNYLEIKRFLNAKQAGGLPPFEMVQKRTPGQTDELPWGVIMDDEPPLDMDQRAYPFGNP